MNETQQDELLVDLALEQTETMEYCGQPQRRNT